MLTRTTATLPGTDIPAAAERVRPPHAVVDRLHSLDLLRGLCAAGVASYHYSTWSQAQLPQAIKGLLLLFGTYGVSAFFVLSGYSLAHAYYSNFSDRLERPALVAYGRRRFGRLAPLFVAVVIASVAAKIFVLKKSVDPVQVIGNVTLLFGFVDPASTPVIGGWSIGIEVVFYLVFPLLMLMRNRPLVVLASAALMSVWLSVALAHQGSLEKGWTVYVHPANHWLFFCAGALLRLYRDRLPLRSPAFGWIGLAAIVVSCFVTAGSDFELTTGWRRAVLVPVTIALIAVTACWTVRGVAAQKISSMAGGASYTLYLLHPLLYFGLKGRLDASQPLAWLAFFGFAVVVAVVADRLVDTPIQRSLKRRGW